MMDTPNIKTECKQSRNNKFHLQAKDTLEKPPAEIFRAIVMQEDVCAINPCRKSSKEISYKVVFSMCST